MKIPLVDLRTQYFSIKKEIDGAIFSVLNSGNFILGENVHKLEEEIAKYCRVKYAVSVASGTDALFLSLKSLGIGKGDEVITTPFTFVATAEAISNLGAKPVFVDIDERTYNIDVNLIEKKITKNTKAIIPVHLFGQIANMKKISCIAKKYNLKIVEDATQAFGAEQKINNKKYKSGSLGEIGCFSFFPSKNLGCYGDGGMIISNNKELIEKVRILRSHGGKTKYYHSVCGYNSRLDEIQAAILRVKLKYIDKWNKMREKNALYYNKRIEEESLPITTPHQESFNKHIYHIYTIKCKDRDKLKEYLNSQGISCAIYYPLPLHLQLAYAYLGYKLGSFKQSEQAAKQVLALPMYPELTKETIDRIISQIKKFFAK